MGRLFQMYRCRGSLNASAYADAKCSGFCSRVGERGRGQASPLHLRIAAYQRARTVSRSRMGTVIGTIGTVGTGDSAEMEYESTLRLGMGTAGFGESLAGSCADSRDNRAAGILGTLGTGVSAGLSAEQPGHGERMVLKG